MPLLVLVFSWVSPDAELWTHFQETLLNDLVTNTLILMLGVGVGTLIIGGGMAWLVSMCEFPGRRYFEVLLFLPFAIPAYVLGFVYLGLFDYSGPMQGFLMEVLGIKGFDIRASSFSVILIFSLVFYPYVYMLARVAFASQSLQMLHSAQTLGANDWRIFRQITLPMARPALIAGVTLALMETLSDFGVVSLFNYDTFTTAIYSAWEDYRSVDVAAQLASLLVLISFGLIWLEQTSRGRAKYYSNNPNPQRAYQLKGWKAFSATFIAGLILLLAFIIPLLQLLGWAWEAKDLELSHDYWKWISNSLLLAGMAGLITLILALLFVLIKREEGQSLWVRLLIRISTLGYALPGSVMAIGVLYAFGLLTDWVVLGSVIVLLMAYTTRFMAVAFSPLESAIENIKPSYIEAAKTLGAGRFRLMKDVYVPMLFYGMLVAFILVVVDVMKELPATYLLRPYGWDTLAIRIYELTSEALYARAAIPSLILVGLTSLLLIALNILRKGR